MSPVYIGVIYSSRTIDTHTYNHKHTLSTHTHTVFKAHTDKRKIFEERGRVCVEQRTRSIFNPPRLLGGPKQSSRLFLPKQGTTSSGVGGGGVGGGVMIPTNSTNTTTTTKAMSCNKIGQSIEHEEKYMANKRELSQFSIWRRDSSMLFLCEQQRTHANGT